MAERRGAPQSAGILNHEQADGTKRSQGGKAGPAVLIALYATTIFTGAALLFIVQPMFARMVLPLLGGSPATWNTTMVFYQVTLLAGYAYAHVSTTFLRARHQAVLHLVILVLPLAILPIAIPPGWTPPTQVNPSAWLLALMLMTVGLPFFAVSTMSPLIQKWFAATTHGQAGDPYFLYAASNTGSMVALLSYPLWIEPNLHLEQQSRCWMIGYGLLAVMAAGCVAGLWLASPRDAAADNPAGSTPDGKA